MTDGENDDTRRPPAEPAGEEPEAPEAGPAGGEALGADASEDEESLRELVRGAFGGSEPEAPDVLRGVQKKLRARSGGKFYTDVWSTTRHPPIALYLLTSLLMLFIVLAVYLVLSPTAGQPVHVDNTPAPVHILPPRR